MDIIATGKGGGMAVGSVAQRLFACNMDVRQLRPYLGTDGRSYFTANAADGKAVALETNAGATLRYDEWKFFDTAVQQIARQRLALVNFLRGRGLTLNMGGKGMASTVLAHEKISDMTGATLSMDGLNRGDNDRPVFDIGYTPLPITHKDWQLNARFLAMSRAGNTPLDTTSSEVAARKSADLIEDMCFNGASSYAFGGGVIYGLLDFPSNHDVEITDWLASGADPVGDVQKLKIACGADNFHGPYALRVSKNWERVLDDDYGSSYPKTIRQRISELSGIASIEVADQLADDNVVLWQLSADVFRVIDGLDLTPVEWQVEGGMAINYKVLSIVVPQPRADYDGRCGIAHGQPA